MWLQDLKNAVVKLQEERPDFKTICLKDVRPCADGGIIFRTTYFTYIKVYRNGIIEEYDEEGNLKK